MSTDMITEQLGIMTHTQLFFIEGGCENIQVQHCGKVDALLKRGEITQNIRFIR